MVAWYGLSTRALNAWKDAATHGLPDPGFGLAGPIPWSPALLALILGLVLMLLWLPLRKRLGRAAFTLGLITWTMALGASLGLAIWAFFSHRYCQQQPGALSFQWLGTPVFVCYVLIGIVWLTCGRVQPREKWAGLTLFPDKDTKTP